MQLNNRKNVLQGVKRTKYYKTEHGNKMQYEKECQLIFFYGDYS